MTRRRQVEVCTQSPDGRSGSIFDWPWPPSPVVFKVYDKYADVESCLVYGERVWTLPVQGRTEPFEFAVGAAGLLQQKLVCLTQADSSPSSIYKFARSLLRNWSTYVQILEDGPESIENHWDEQVHDIDTARAAKAILHLACSSSLGLWKEVHRSLIKGLDSHSNAAWLAQRGARRRREKLLDLNRQTRLVKVLDARTSEDDLDEWEAEGLAALALTFQHGMRPVQLLSLLVEHINAFKDAAGDWVCVVSFHTGKQQGSRTDNGEVLRQVKPEWVKPVIALLEYARREKRTRLFSRSTGDQLWAKVKRVCADSGFKVDFTAVALRHTSAQALADAGCVFRTNVTGRFGIVTGDFGNVTGHFGNVTERTGRQDWRCA
jgi:integrase